MTEATITINGHQLTQAQSMTARVALVTMAVNLKSRGLGDDEHGIAMTEGYLARIHEIVAFMRPCP